MQTYQYKARDKFSRPIMGLMSADSEAVVANKLKEMGYTPVSIQEAEVATKVEKFFERFSRKIKQADLNMFTRQLAALQKAGIPILASLKTLKEEVKNKKLRDILGQILRDIEGGASLSLALSKFPLAFGALYVNMVKTGEASGQLAGTLERLAELGEYDERVNRQIKAATRYPFMVVIAISVGFLVLTTLVIPRFVRIYAQFGVNLPLPTRVLIWINMLMTKYWWLLLLALAASIFSLMKFIQTKQGRLLVDTLKLRLPVFGPLILKIIMARFSRIVGTMMKSGVALFEILDLTSGGVGNVVVARTIENIKESIAEGKGLSEPMRLSGMFTPTVVQMVSVGEQSGKLDDLLLNVADYYDAQVEYTISNLTSLIEPVLILFLGIAVAFMALGIFLPMWNLMSLFRR
jgi:type II secretory pathway component PulF